MCGRYTFTTRAEKLAERLGIDEIRPEALALDPSWNVAPTQPVAVVAERGGVRQLGVMRWGLVPSWAESPASGSRMINARSESAADKPAYRLALARRRCLIPADAFYEWRIGPVGARQPYAIARKDREPMAFAGLWEIWRDPTAPDSALLRTCAILTTAANEVLNPIHPRMPVVLPPEAWPAWLSRGRQDATDALRLLVTAGPTGGRDLEAWAVAPLVNRATANGPELLEPLPQGDAGQIGDPRLPL